MKFLQPSIEGSYRLHVAQFHAQINAEQFFLSLCHAYILNIVIDNMTKIIKLTPLSLQGVVKISENPICTGLLSLLTQINRYEIMGKMLLLYDNNNRILFRGVKNKHTDQNESIEGEWMIEPINLPLQVRDGRFQFKGLENKDYILNYTTANNNKIQITYTKQNKNYQQKKDEVVQKFDELFIDSLLQAKSYQLGQVSFQLFDSSQRVVAKGMPYLV